MPEQTSETRESLVREGGRQSLAIVQDALVQVAGGEIEPAGLVRQRLHHMGMAMADVGHVVVGVEVDAPVAVPDPDPLPLHQVQWAVVEERRAGAEQPMSTFKQRVV